jgi:hypothetical protein
VRSHRLLCLSLIALAAMLAEARATILPPDGTTHNMSAPIALPPQLVSAAPTLVDPFTNIVGGKKLEGTLYSDVYRLSASVVEDGITYHKNDLVFGYKLVTAGGNQKVTGFDIGGYNQGAGDLGRFDAQQIVQVGATQIFSASYDGSVTSHTLNFSPSLGVSGTSNQLLLFTHAPLFTTDFASVLGTSGTSASGLPIYVPFTATPEPGTIALACAGLPVLGLYQLLRRRRANDA